MPLRRATLAVAELVENIEPKNAESAATSWVNREASSCFSGKRDLAVMARAAPVRRCRAWSQPERAPIDSDWNSSNPEKGDWIASRRTCDSFCQA